ncbi:MAG: PD-(D/E)XK nuclease family protein [Alphaproteobacteria bacterium]
MALNKKNIFCASNPTKLTEVLWSFLSDHDFSNDVIFLPSRRAIRVVEEFITFKSGNAVLLPKLVALGESPEDEEEIITGDDVVSNIERMLVLSKLLSAAESRSFSSVLPIARDLIRMQDYIENEQDENNKTKIDWESLVDEKFATHFQKKAKFLSLADSVLPSIFPDKITESAKRNMDIRDWIGREFSGQVIVCGSTASVPATSDLMEYIALLPNGKIILPGKITGTKIKDIDICNPYYSEYKFLQKIGISPDKVIEINVGKSNIDFFNSAFDNNQSPMDIQFIPFTRIDCARESEEAMATAEIASRAINNNKSVLVITPDAAGNQRLKEAFAHRDLVADFSGGTSGTMTLFGRNVLNKFDELGELKIENAFNFINGFNLDFAEDDLPIIEKIKEISDILCKHGIILSLSDLRAIIMDVLSSVHIRPVLNSESKIRVLGTIESRMQTADVVILTGLNEGMFPAIGYENPWLPRRIAQQIGLPPPERKVSLMALDFINLSNGLDVYWLRSKTAGGTQTTESRFLSRIEVALRNKDLDAKKADKILNIVRGFDMVAPNPLDYSSPTPPADRRPVYVTKLELLIHNPYAFYANHILGLRPKDDWWITASAKDFGTLVHGVIEHVARNSNEIKSLVQLMDEKAREILPDGSVLFHFWHKRFVEMESEIQKMLKDSIGGKSEIEMETKIVGRTVRAIADRVWDSVVMDIKTGKAPNKSQLEQGNMPQLPLEAFMRGARIIQFLQLQNNNIKLIEYSGEQLQRMVEASVQKASELFGRYSKDFEPYEYYETSDQKYKAYDDLARIKD